MQTQPVRDTHLNRTDTNSLSLQPNGDSALPLAPMLQQALAKALETLARNHRQFVSTFPDDTTRNSFYPLRAAQGGMPAGSNMGWTTGFVPGAYWLAWELSGDDLYRQAAQTLVPTFIQRIDAQIDVDTHDLGFLYTLSCVAAWRLTNDGQARRAAVAAANYLMTRFLEPAGILQAWGNLNDPRQRGRTIIDSLMNTPLLYWTSDVTGDPRFAAAARRHTAQLRDNMLRADNSTFHTFYWDTATGAPLRGETAQGYSNDSCWARGQAWGIYGFALNHRFTGDAQFLDAAVRCADYYLAHLPADGVPRWDLSFALDSSEERDSSAAAIAICGLLETVRWIADEPLRTRYRNAANLMLRSLVTDYTPVSAQESDALLLQGVYSKPEGKGVNEGNLWGDYFFMEALMRVRNPEWRIYW